MLVLASLAWLCISFFLLIVCCLLGGPLGFVGWCIMMGVSSICQVMMYTAHLKMKGAKQ